MSAARNRQTMVAAGCGNQPVDALFFRQGKHTIGSTSSLERAGDLQTFKLEIKIRRSDRGFDLVSRYKRGTPNIGRNAIGCGADVIQRNHNVSSQKRVYLPAYGCT